MSSSSNQLTFNARTEHKYPEDGFLTTKKIKEDKNRFYARWKATFKRSMTELNQKLLKDIKMFKALIAYVQTYDSKMDNVRQNIKTNYDFDEIKDLKCLVNVSCLEYEYMIHISYFILNYNN